MSSDNPVPDIVDGIVRGVLRWSDDKIAEFVNKFKNGKLAFIEEKKTIDIAREQFNSGESKFYQKYVKDKEILLLIRVGLTLRKLQNDKERRLNLRDKIFKKYKVSGLHIAEFVENGTLNKYTSILLEGLVSIDDLEKEIVEILGNIEKYTLFVQYLHKSSDIIKKTAVIVSAHSPRIFIISGAGPTAEVVRKVIDELSKVMKGYSLKRMSSIDKEILFFKQILIK